MCHIETVLRMFYPLSIRFLEYSRKQEKDTHLINKFMLLVVLALPCYVLAQNGDATTSCGVTFSSGSGVNASQFCVTENGNITQFSRDGEEFINFGTVGEGYGICDVTGNGRYYDYAYEDSGNWNLPSFTHSGNVVTVTRTTSDGIWQLTQTITHLPANGSNPAAANISMALKNLSGTNRIARLMRYVDVDANSTSSNVFGYTRFSVWGFATGGFYGLSVTSSTYGPLLTPIILTTPGGPDVCDATIAALTFAGDGAIMMSFLENPIPAGATRKVIIKYKPF